MAFFLTTNINTFFALFRFISILCLFSLFQPLFADVDSRRTPPPFMTAASLSIPSPPPPLPDFVNTSSPFKPSIAIIVGVLTAMFSITLLLLLYAKHCKRADGVVYNGFHGDSMPGGGPSTGRKNSGIDRAVIESLPIFRFSSLRGQKDGLECAVCLTKFESLEVLRLLPKCKHAFHVECVDTWLDAHSTCPLCRCRVDPEDILLIDHDFSNILHPPPEDRKSLDVERGTAETESEVCIRRISGRHSSAGEKATNCLSQIVIQRPSGGSGSERVPCRCHHSNGPSPPPTTTTTSFARRSLDSFSLRKKSTGNESVTVGCFDRYQSHQRKDELLLTNNNGDGDCDGDPHRRSRTTTITTMDRTRFEHRIIVSGSGFHHRWSDVQPSDLLYLGSEMIISDNDRLSSVIGSRPSVGRSVLNLNNSSINNKTEGMIRGGDGDSTSGRNVINGRSVSEITGLNRFLSRESNNSHHHRERQAGVVSRWLAWISSQSHAVVRSDRTSSAVAVTRSSSRGCFGRSFANLALVR